MIYKCPICNEKYKLYTIDNNMILCEKCGNIFANIKEKTTKKIKKSLNIFAKIYTIILLLTWLFGFIYVISLRFNDAIIKLMEVINK